MMLDADVGAVGPSSVYRVLCDAGSMKAHDSKPSLEGKGFQQPLRPHECSLLDGCSRFTLGLEDARRAVAEFVADSHEVRLHGAIGHVTPADRLAGRERTTFAGRDRKPDAARERRRAAREASRSAV